MTGQVEVINLEEELRSSFLDYSMSVIVSRALPDVRDGLKPVQRRILYAMQTQKNTHNRPYMKSARTVGEVIGKYHPHGEGAVYDAMVRLAQDFNLRYPLIDGQGNFGSIDGDPAAAMRYTEARLQKIADAILADLDKETVDFGPNYDDKEFEPLVLPSRLPQLLVNGASGIAVGMATNIPPHNIREVVNAVLALIDNPDITIDGLIEHIQGPDFPTAGEIRGVSGIISAYRTGRGSIVMRSRVEFEESKRGRDQIIVKEIPYQVNKARLIERIADLVREKKLEGISDLRDESVKGDMRIVIELRKGEVPDVVLNHLYKQTQMQHTFGVNMVGLIKGVPKLLNLKHLLEEFYIHRREVVIRRTAFELRKAQERAHILEGLKIAVENLDAVVALIRAAPDSATAQTELIEQHALSEIQAKAVLEMRLSRLTGLEREKIIKDYEEVMALIADLRDILDRPERVTEIIRDELNEVRETFGDDRRTKIVTQEADDITVESLVADEEVAVMISHAGYVKRTPITTIRAQKRGGKGRKGMDMRAEDLIRDLFISSNHQTLLCFSNKGRVFALKVYQFPEAALAARGKHFRGLVGLGQDEDIRSVLPLRAFEEGRYIVTITRKGVIKKTDLMAYANVRSSGIIGLKLDEGDEVVKSAITEGNQDIIIATRMGKAIRFGEGDVRPMGRTARGTTGIRFSEDGDEVVGLEVISGASTILSVCENGFGKRTPLEEYRTQARGGKGIYTIKVTERNGPVVGIVQVDSGDDLMVMTNLGKVVRFNADEVGVVGRLTQGVRLMSVEGDEKLIKIAKIAKIEGEEVQ